MKSLAERLLKALETGQKIGGDKRGKASAALKVYGQKDLWIDLRVDFHPNPVMELKRIFERYIR
jgi:uncharacterized Ntn-hydrolase superfamily protein